jgi:hypothetical protein
MATVERVLSFIKELFIGFFVMKTKSFPEIKRLLIKDINHLFRIVNQEQFPYPRLQKDASFFSFHNERVCKCRHCILDLDKDNRYKIKKTLPKTRKGLFIITQNDRLMQNASTGIL